MLRFIIICVLATGALGGTGQARAATSCVTTSAQLQAALILAAYNDEVDEIRVATGSYAAPPGGFVYDAESIVDGDHHNISISGGWNNDCGQQLAQDPFLTVLSGNGTARVLEMRIRTFTNVEVRLLAFVGGNAPGAGGGLLIWHDNDDGHLRNVLIERNVFLGNVADNGAGLSAYGGTGGLRVINNLFVGNHSEGGSAVYLGRNGFQTGQGIFAINNTVVGNTTPDGVYGIGGLQITYYPAGTVVTVANNILWGNDGFDLAVFGDSLFKLYHNNLEDSLGIAPSDFAGNIAVEPEYEQGLFNYTPVRNSALVDAGYHPTSGSPWDLPDLDLKGEARIVGPGVDIGAFENERIFANGFDPDGLF